MSCIYLGEDEAAELSWRIDDCFDFGDSSEAAELEAKLEALLSRQQAPLAEEGGCAA